MSMDATPTMLDSMDAETAFQMVGGSQQRVRITFDVGQAEAAERQRVAGVGDVTQDGYVRETYSTFLRDMAEADPDATVEEL